MAVHPKAREFGDGIPAGAHFDIDRFLANHGNSLLANARRHSANGPDADDAYQRALEILLTKRPDIASEEQLAAWMHTVVRNEALQLHRRRKHEINTTFDEISEGWLGDAPPAEEALIDTEDVARSREALGRINPDQTRCLLLRAEGRGYPEICEITGFSYAKVNRLLSEGRKSLIAQVGMIESGAECRRLFPALSMIADGESDGELCTEAESHLKNCLSCKATVRDMRAAPKDLAAVFPVGFAFAIEQRGFFGRLFDQVQSTIVSAYDRVFGHAAAGQGAEVITAKKIAGATAIVAALAGGGAITERAINDDKPAAPKTAPAQSAGGTDLVDAIPARVRRAAEQRKARAAARREERARELDLQETANSPGTVGAEAADDGFAADPNAGVPEGAAEDTGTDVGGLAP